VKAYRLLLAALALALAAALVAWAIGTDPGYVRIERGRWIVETSLTFAVIATFVAVALALLVVWLVRWPLIAMLRRRRREGRTHYVRGALALAEGRPQRAEHQLLRASKLATLRTPALIGAHDAARQRGDAAREREILDRLSAQEDGVVIATVRRAAAELASGRAGAAIEMLVPLDQSERLPPAGARVLVDAYAARGRTREALPHLSRLRRGNVMSPADYDRYEAAILARALTETSDAINLRSLWAELNRVQRRDPAIATAYAERAAQLKLGDEAAREIEGILAKQWSEPLVEAYARLAGDASARLRWLEREAASHPNSAALMLALGRLCRELSLWGKAEDALQRALALGAGARAFEELGHLHAAQGLHERASRAYASAFAAARGETPAPAPRLAPRPDALAPPALEERDQHGVPRLPRPS